MPTAMRALPCAILALLLAACAGDEPRECSAFRSCEERGDVCLNESERCTCEVGSGLSWQCEPQACPEGETPVGESCPTAGLHCDVGFERGGTRCVAPELVWVVCGNYFQGDPSRNSCPPTPPTVGAPCCQALIHGGPTLGCAYDDVVYDCVGEHWVQVAATR